jgi:hypothetical protein
MTYLPTQTEELAESARFRREVIPMSVTWSDKRPIVRDFLNPGGSPLPSASLKVRRDWGTAKLAQGKDKAHQYADAGCGGYILWDAEGEWAYQNKVAYLGDPRLVHTYNPAFWDIAADYFGAFAAAGLKTGLTLYDGKLQPGSTAGVFVKVRTTDGHMSVDDLCNKAKYAAKLWGCSLFYVDSFWPYNGPDLGSPDITPYDHTKTARLHARMPDVLWMPEASMPQWPTEMCHAGGMPYREAKTQGLATSERDRRVYPGAGSMIYSPDAPVGAGDIRLIEHGSLGNLG